MVRTHDVDACPDPTSLTGPVRTCVGCRERAAKSELLRVVVVSDAHGPTVVPDPTGSMPGRGAHLHPTTACYDLAVRRRSFTRAFRLGQGPTSAAVGEFLGTS